VYYPLLAWLLPQVQKHTYSTNQGASQIPPSGWSRRSLHNTFEGNWLIRHTKVMNNGCILVVLTWFLTKEHCKALALVDLFFFGLTTEILEIWGLVIHRWKGIENTFPMV
jgi:hypothetical protein